MKKYNLSITLLFLASCSTDPTISPDNDGPSDSPQHGAVAICKTERDQAEMVKITTGSGTDICIDRYEAFLISGDLGDANQNSDETSFDGNGSTTAKVGSLRGKRPLINVSWYQAQAACQNSGAHLCSQEEWEAACRGGDKYLYPYGNTFVEQQCNDSFYRAAHDDLSATFDPLQHTGAFDKCLSSGGVYDLSGNIEEWVATPTPSLPDSDVLDHRQVRGGSYRSNTPALQCVNPDAHHSPNEGASDRGFRCCISIEDNN